MSEEMKNPKVERHMKICEALNDIYEKKNHDYGDSFHETFLEEGYAMARIRLSDKLNRFKNLSRQKTACACGISMQVDDESLRDTLLDLANYAIMTVMEMDISDEEAYAEISRTLKEVRPDLNGWNEANSKRKTCPSCGSPMVPGTGSSEGLFVCARCGTRWALNTTDGDGNS